MLGRLEHPVRDLDRPTVVIAHEVRARELTEQRDAGRMAREISELGGGRLEESRSPPACDQTEMSACAMALIALATAGRSSSGGVRRSPAGSGRPRPPTGRQTAAASPASSRRSAVSAGSIVTSRAWSRKVSAWSCAPRAIARCGGRLEGDAGLGADGLGFRSLG